MLIGTEKKMQSRNKETKAGWTDKKPSIISEGLVRRYLAAGKRFKDFLFGLSCE